MKWFRVGSLKLLTLGSCLFSLQFAVALIADPQIDIPYGPHPKQRLDAHWPEAASRFPVVVFIHGGSLETGDKADEDYKDVWKPFPGAGIACITINYRLAADASWPAQAEDCAAALAWARRAIMNRGGNTGRIVIVGHSSGAMLASVLAADARFLIAQGLKPTDLAGVVPMGSIMWDEEFETSTAKAPPERIAAAFQSDPIYRMFRTPEAYRDFWPMKHVNADMPPFLFLVAEAEQEQPPILKHAKAFCEAARKFGVEAEWRVLPDRTHYSAIRKLSEKDDPTFVLIRNFVFGRK